ncbi:MAG TPA: hypothetical protein VEG30_06125 [Terriglobales bacterium]|nr:hypothetical protein [Terriglobales bacterium]
MPRVTKPGPTAHTHPSSFLGLLSGWVQQGVESFFATQRILVDLAMRQNAVAMKSLREGLSDPEHSPIAILRELAVEGTSSFIEAQRILLNLAQQENEIVMTGIKERVAGSVPAVAMTDLVRRSIGTFLGMHEDFLKITSKQTLEWLEETKKSVTGGTHLVDLARQAMETFVHAQKKFLDVVAEETTRVTTGRPDKTARMVKKTALAKLARDASNAFIDAQKKLLDTAGQQMNVNLKAATRTMELLNPARLIPMANITGEGVKSFVDAEKALIDSVVKPRAGSKHMSERRVKHPVRRKAATAQAAHHAVA